MEEAEKDASCMRVVLYLTRHHMDSWKRVQQEQNLGADSSVAIFLISLYEECRSREQPSVSFSSCHKSLPGLSSSCLECSMPHQQGSLCSSQADAGDSSEQTLLQSCHHRCPETLKSGKPGQFSDTPQFKHLKCYVSACPEHHGSQTVYEDLSQLSQSDLESHHLSQPVEESDYRTCPQCQTVYINQHQHQQDVHCKLADTLHSCRPMNTKLNLYKSLKQDKCSVSIEAVEHPVSSTANLNNISAVQDKTEIKNGEKTKCQSCPESDSFIPRACLTENQYICPQNVRKEHGKDTEGTASRRGEYSDAVDADSTKSECVGDKDSETVYENCNHTEGTPSRIDECCKAERRKSSNQESKCFKKVITRSREGEYNNPENTVSTNWKGNKDEGTMLQTGANHTDCEEREPLCQQSQSSVFWSEPSQQHTLQHDTTDDSRPFQCQMCHASFTTASHLKTHVSSHSFLSPLHCTHCGLSCPDSEQLHQHTLTHTQDRPFLCPLCPLAFTRASYRTVHVRNAHTGEKPHKCPQCGKAYADARNLKVHLRKHTGERPFLCHQCGRSFADPCNLVRHRRGHSRKKQYHCTICGATFTSSGSLTYHLRRHQGVKPYLCHECGMAFTSASQLTEHQRTHLGLRPFTCSECGASFTRAQNLKTHFLRHSGQMTVRRVKQYTCEHCQAVYTDNRNFARHIRVHTGEKPYKCTECSAAFAQPGDLKKHGRIHSGEKPFSCPHCSAVFRHSSALTVHLRMHTGDRPYHCQHCDSSFVSSSKLTLHIQAKHK